MKREDRDTIFEDFGAFAARIGVSLTDWQAASLQLPTRITSIVAPRQSGKSRSLAALALWWAFRKPQQSVLIVSAGEDASRRLLADVKRFATSSPLLAGSVVDEQSALVTVSNVSTVRSVPASERAIRGWSTDLLLADEAALVPDDVLLGAAFPTTAARPEARIVMASSPWAAGGAFYDHVHAGDSEHHRVYRWSLGDCSWIAREAIEAARASMSAARFAAEYEARWAAETDALYSRQVLERCTADIELPDLAELHGPARVIGGADWGVVRDRNAVAYIARLPGVSVLNGEPLGPVYAARTFAWAPGTPLSDVVAEIAASPAHWGAFFSEQNGVGAGPTQELFRLLGRRPPDAGGAPRLELIEERPWLMGEPPPPVRGWTTAKIGVATSAPGKAVVYERLRWLADRGQLVLPRDGDLLRELAALRVELRPGGDEKIEAGVGHDDRADSLYLAAGPKRGFRGWYCALAEIAQRRRPEAELPPAMEGAPVVETGGGLKVFRRPALQSVAGHHVTPPGSGVRAQTEPAGIGGFRFRRSWSA